MPAESARRTGLELGLFPPSTRSGTILAAGTPPQQMPSFALNRAVTLMAEEAGFEFVLSQSKWRGYGGAAQHWDIALEPLTLMSALAAVTQRIRLYASVGVRTIHPVIAAKMAATIDDVSGGRFGLNIIAGWNQHEYARMGLWAEDDYHAYCYAYAQEYLEVLQVLWAHGRATHRGRFFQLEHCLSLPTSGRKLPIVCAGQSDDALRFTARYADFSFVGRQADTPERLAALSAKLGGMAAEHGRTVGSYLLLTVIAEETDAAAEAKRDHSIANTDQEGVAELMRISGLDASRTNFAELRTAARTFMGMPFIAVSYPGVAEHLEAIAGAGLTGLCLVFADFEPDLRRFIDHVVPLMRSRAQQLAVPASDSRPGSRWSPARSRALAEPPLTPSPPRARMSPSTGWTAPTRLQQRRRKCGQRAARRSLCAPTSPTWRSPRAWWRQLSAASASWTSW